jgi:hypothetical protein
LRFRLYRSTFLLIILWMKPGHAYAAYAMCI